MISSTGNALVKRARALRLRKERESTGTFWVEGLRHVGEAVDSGAEIETLIVAPELLSSEFGRETVERLRARHVSVAEVTDEVFRSLSSREGPQGIGAVVRTRWQILETIDLGCGTCWVALERPADPGNLGTILRTCDAAGAGGLMLLGESTDPYDPASVRGSMGTIFTVPLVRAGIEEFARWVRGSGVHVVGTSDRGSVHYRDAAYPLPLVILMGSEREGLSEGLLALCEEVVSIPMRGHADSLNLAVATALILYEVASHPTI